MLEPQHLAQRGVRDDPLFELPAIETRGHRQAQGCDEFAGLLAGDGRPRQSVPMKQEFDETGAQKRGAGGDVGGEVRPVNLDGDPLPQGLLLGQPDPGDLGMGIDDRGDRFFPDSVSRGRRRDGRRGFSPAAWPGGRASSRR